MVKRSKETPLNRWRKLLALLPGYDSFATAKPDMVFDAPEADRAVGFFHEHLKHIEGAMATKSFILEPWQQAVIGAMFGWKRGNYRRYREVLLYCPRKQGKTPMAAGCALYSLMCDGEVGAQNLCAAADVDQAGLVFRHARGMVEANPELKQRVEIFAGGTGTGGQRTLFNREYESTLKVISSDASTKHGFNGHFAVIDELHAQPNRDLVDVIETAMASANRKQPLFLMITTADFDRPSICNEKYDYACKVRDGVIDDAAFLPVVYEAGRDAEWKEETTWQRANPNLGVSVDLDYLRRACRKAQDTPTFENTFKRLHLNMRTEQDVRWLQLDQWDKCDAAIDLTALAGQPCVGALDLSTTTDLTAFVLLFDDGSVLPFFWIPADRAKQREDRDRVPYLTWARQDLLDVTPGGVIDYGQVRAKVNELKRHYQIRSIGIDPWNATAIAQQLKEQDGFEMVEFRQGYKSMNEPMKQLEALILSGKIKHGGNPILRWMASNVTADIDEAGNVKPDKAKSTGRIDGIVALIMAVGMRMVTPFKKPSKYETEELFTT